MKHKLFFSIGLICLSAAAPAAGQRAPAAGQRTIPRPAPELRIVEPSGRTTLLSSYRGNVVLLAFIVPSCAHCRRESQIFESLLAEFGSKGLKVAEAAFDEPAAVPAYVKQLGLTFPVGRVDRATMAKFLGLPPDTRLGTPQVVIIDRIGMIRAQSARLGSPVLQQKDVLESLIASMLPGKIRQ